MFLELFALSLGQQATTVCLWNFDNVSMKSYDEFRKWNENYCNICTFENFDYKTNIVIETAKYSQKFLWETLLQS